MLTNVMTEIQLLASSSVIQTATGLLNILLANSLVPEENLLQMFALTSAEMDM